MSPMMISLLSVLVLVAYANMASAGNKRQLHDYCQGLRREMKPFKKPEESLMEAKRIMGAGLVFGGYRGRLIKAWEVMVHEEPCSPQSGEYVATIAECNPSEDNEMSTLYAAVKNYANKCLTPTFWDQQLKKTLGSGDKTGLLKFMDQQFLDQYRKDNAGERALHFSAIGGPNCCEARRSHKALLVALTPIVGDESEVKHSIKSDRRKFERVLQKQLFKPCENYMKLMDTLMLQASESQDYYKGGRQAYMEAFSQEFKDAIFRYKYCSSFAYLDGAGEKSAKIDLSKFL